MIANTHKVKRAKVGSIDSIEITGPFDFNDPQVDSIAIQIMEEGKQTLAFDLSKVSYITSPGISSIIKVLKKIHSANGLLYINGATPDMVDLFRLAAVDKFIRFM
jgi:anti-anti-sigma regulatory factor